MLTNRKFKYKLFPNLYVYSVNQEHIGIFHPLTLKTTFISSIKANPLFEYFQKSDFLNFTKDNLYLKQAKTILPRLIRDEILVTEHYDYRKRIESMKIKIISQKPKLSVGYFIISDLCNLRCNYCHILDGLPPFYKQRNMSQKVAFESATFFAFNAYRGNNNSPHPRVYFYGGEPLLNFSAIKLVTNTIRKYETKIDPDRRTQFVLVTNGTLITRDIIKFLVESNFAVAVSLDGFDEATNSQRINKLQGRGSFKDALRGYKMFKKEGVNIGISCTIGYHNMVSLPKIAEFFATNLKPSRIGFNFMRETFEQKNTCNVDIHLTSQALIKSYEILRNYKIHEDRIDRHLTPEGELKFHFYYCAGYGDQLVFAPDGSIGPCHAYLGSRKYFFANLFRLKENVFQSYILKLWRGHTPFNMKECLFCPAISICGGGCAQQAEMKTGAFLGKDEKMCIFYNKYFLKWYIEDKYKDFLRTRKE